LSLQTTYYAFFHPTGVEIDLCCFKRDSGRRTEAVETVEHAERPTVLDLREGVPAAEAAADVGNVSSAKTKSRLSVSRCG
jgi:hypothetical protein